MRIKSFEFNIRELAGSMGNLGTLLPFAIGYIVVCGLDPSGLLIMTVWPALCPDWFLSFPCLLNP